MRKWAAERLSRSNGPPRVWRACALLSVVVFFNTRQPLRPKEMKVRFVLGCDFSLSSPGVMLMDSEAHVLYAIGWADRKREIGLQCQVDQAFAFWGGVQVQKFVLRMYDPIDIKASVVSRAHKISTDLMGFVRQVGCVPDNTVVGIEGYAFNAQGCSMTRLSELGGICKHSLFRHGFAFVEYPPTHVKKMFCGKGNANKLEMCQWYHDKSAQRPSLFNLLGLRLSPKNKVPHPIEDLVDAFAVVVTTYRNQVCPTKSGKKRKSPPTGNGKERGSRKLQKGEQKVC